MEEEEVGIALPVEKVEIQGPTLASLLHRISSSSSDVDGLLFGHLSHFSPSSLSDDPSSSSASATTPHLIATVTSFLCPSSSPHSLPSSLLLRRHRPSSSHLLGWFSARRNTPLRPSMREFSVSLSLSSNSELCFPVLTPPPSSLTTPLSNSTPCLFLLFTTPPQQHHDQFIHTYEYRAYYFSLKSAKFDPKQIHIVNIGPDFRGHYSNFSPRSPFPALNCEVGAMMSEDRKEETLSEMKEVAKDQRDLDAIAEGFEVGKLRRLVGSEAVGYTSGLEELYEKMLVKIDSLARELEKSNDLVVEQVTVFFGCDMSVC